MNNGIKHNIFYNTFTPFICEKTITAEKTMNDIRTVKTDKPPKKLHQTLYNYVSAGGFLLVPIFALSASRVHLGRMMQKLDKEYFLAVNDKFAGGFLKGISTKFTLLKYSIVNGLAQTIKPLRKRKQMFFNKYTAEENSSLMAKLFRKMNNFFIQRRTAAIARLDKKVKNNLGILEKNIEKLLKTIEQSENGKVKILVPKVIAKNPSDEFPHAIDLSKTSLGKKRTQEIRKILSEIKSYFKEDSPDYDKFLHKVTHSCEDVFSSAQNSLIYLRKHLEKKRPEQLEKSKALIKDIYNDLIKYRYGEIAENMPNLSSNEAREIHLAGALAKTEILKKSFKKDKVVNAYISRLERNLIKSKDQKQYGLIEKIRYLIKCNDISYEHVKDNLRPSLLKLCKPDEYIEVKKSFNEFIKSLKQAHVSKKYMLPTYSEELERGKILVNTFSTLLPAGILSWDYISTKEDKTEQKKNLLAFLTGSGVMMGTHYFGVFSRIKSIIWGLITAFATAKTLDNLPKNNLSKN